MHVPKIAPGVGGRRGCSCCWDNALDVDVAAPEAECEDFGWVGDAANEAEVQKWLF